MHTLRFLTILLVAALWANSAIAQAVPPVPSEARVYSNILFCDTEAQLRVAIDEINTPNPFPPGCRVQPGQRPVLGTVKLTGEDYVSDSVTYYLAVFVFTHGVTPNGMFPFAEGPVTKYGVWWRTQGPIESSA